MWIIAFYKNHFLQKDVIFVSLLMKKKTTEIIKMN